MRSTSELVQEMMEEATQCWLVAIAVGFPDETQFVFSREKEPLRELNRMVSEGGHPVGLLRFEKQAGNVQGAYRPFIEYEGQDWVAPYLEGLLKNTAEIVALGQFRENRPAY